MNPLDVAISTARRRLLLNVVLRWALTGLWVGATGAVAAILAVRLLLPSVPEAGILLGCAGLGLIVAVVGTLRQRPDALTAALTIDQSLGLKERISTALLVRELTDPFARAVVRDAEAQAARVHVPAHVSVRAPAFWPWSGATLVSAVLLYFLMPQMDLLAWLRRPKEAQPDVQQVLAEKKQIETVLASKVQRLQRLAKKDPKLGDLARVLEPLKLPDKADVTPQDVRREALKRVDKIAETLRKRAEDTKFEAVRALKRRLSTLETLKGRDKVSELSRALQAGDTQAARQALSELKKQIQALARRNDAESRAKLAELAKKLDALAAKVDKLAGSKWAEKELERKAGLSESQARELLKKLQGKDLRQIERQLTKQLADKGLTQEQIRQLARKIARQQQAQKLAKNLSQSMSQCAGACKRAAQGGDGASMAGQQAAAALEGADAQLSSVEMAEQLMAEIDAELAELDDVREGLCRGGRAGSKLQRGRVGEQGPNFGVGRGRRIGEKRVAHGYRKTRVRGKRHPGQIIGQMVVDAPMVKGRVQSEVRAVVEAAVREADDAIEKERVPRQYQRVIRDYFLSLAGLVGGEGEAATPAQGMPAEPQERSSQGASDGQKP